jgi:arylsulfatase A-like enzyme
VEQDTLVIFTADHGLSMGHHGFWGHGAAACRSFNLHQAAHSIPLIVSHPGAVESRQCSSLHVSNTDLFATLLEYIGIKALSEPQTPLPA